MKLLAIHIGGIREVEWKGETVETGIFKNRVDGPVRVGRLGLEGDRQADLTVHGGEHKAVYSYAAHYYDEWREQLAPREVPLGIFGENLTIEGMDEAECFVGDHYRIGSAILEAAQPRQPCFKLGIRFGDPSILKKFQESGRWGIYYRVIQEGSLQAGDVMTKIHEHPSRIPVLSVPALARGLDPDHAKARALLAIPTLCPRIRARLEALNN